MSLLEAKSRHARHDSTDGDTGDTTDILDLYGKPSPERPATRRLTLTAYPSSPLRFEPPLTEHRKGHLPIGTSDSSRHHVLHSVSSIDWDEDDDYGSGVASRSELRRTTSARHTPYRGEPAGLNDHGPARLIDELTPKSHVSTPLSGQGSHPSSSPRSHRRSRVFEELTAVRDRINQLKLETDGAEDEVGNERGVKGGVTNGNGNERAGDEGEDGNAGTRHENSGQMPVLDDTDLTAKAAQPSGKSPASKSSSTPGAERFKDNLVTVGEDYHSTTDSVSTTSSVSHQHPRTLRTRLSNLSSSPPYDPAQQDRAPHSGHSGHSRRRSQLYSYAHSPTYSRSAPQPSPSERHAMSVLDRARRLRGNDPLVTGFERVVGDVIAASQVCNETQEQVAALDQVFLSLSEFMLSYCDRIPLDLDRPEVHDRQTITPQRSFSARQPWQPRPTESVPRLHGYSSPFSYDAGPDEPRTRTPLGRSRTRPQSMLGRYQGLDSAPRSGRYSSLGQRQSSHLTYI